MFNKELVQAINDWQRGGDAQQREKRGRALAAAARNLPEEFRIAPSRCYRQIALEKKYVWQMGTEYQLKESIGAWTISFEIAKAFKGGVPPVGYQGVIFVCSPTTDQVVINLHAIFANPTFHEVVRRLEKEIDGFLSGIGKYGGQQQEVVLNVPSLPLDSIFAWGGYTSPESELAKMFFGRDCTAEELEWFRELMRQAGDSCGPGWLSTREAVERTSEKLRGFGVELQEKR